MSEFIKHFSHEHPLESLLISQIRGREYSEVLPYIKVNCCLCQLSLGDDLVYGCKDCDYFIHKECAKLPQHIDHSLHPHHNPLRLDKRSSNNTSTCYYCENPFQNQENLAYICDRCSLQMHVACASIPIPALTCFRNQDTDVIQYVCHQNFMTLVEHDACKSQDKCFACQSLWSGEAYSCTSVICKNFLHKSCAELPWNIQHPFHSKHLLSLQVSKPRSCNLCCKKDCRLIFSCLNGCNFNLGTECAFLVTTVKCHSHDHLLSFVEKAFCDIQCDACRKSYTKWNDYLVPDEVHHTQSFLFRCTECDFNLHFLCGPLPLVIRCDFHRHLLTLVDHFKDDSNENYCDICEEERNPDFRAYYCRDCKYTAHIHCLFSEIMKVIKGNNKDVELMSLGENLWYQFGTQGEMLKENAMDLGENDLTLREVMSGITEKEKEILNDPYALLGSSFIRSQLEERYNFYRLENSPLFDHELLSIEDIDKINQFSRFGIVDLVNFNMELVHYSPREGLKLDEKYLRQKVVDVEGHMVPITLAPILKTLLHKNHESGLFGSGVSSLTHGMRCIIATLLCVVMERMLKTKIEDVTKDDILDLFFCLNAIKTITNFQTLHLDKSLEYVIGSIFLGFEAIRYEKDISEKLDLRITNLEAELERCKEARKMFKTETSTRPDVIKDNMISEASKWKGKNIHEICSLKSLYVLNHCF